jgi:hypothetical protein
LPPLILSLKVLQEQLSLCEEFEAVAAENGSKGVQAAKAGKIDLVIMWI